MSTVRTITYIALSALLFIVPFVTHAQFTGAGLPNETVTLEAIPPAPQPGTSVFVQVNSFSSDINVATISWYLNGVLQKSGLGLKQFRFTVGGIGDISVVIARIETANGTTDQVLRIVPASVDLVWEARSYVPPLYEGKALAPTQGGVRIVAFPDIMVNGQTVAASNLVYTWRQNNVVLGSLSGYGQNVLDVAGSFLGRPIDISVTVATTDGGVAAQAHIVIPTVTPKILVYKRDPLSGVHFEQAFSGNIPLTDFEMSLVAYPLFFSVARRDQLSYAWSIDGKNITDTGGLPNLTLTEGGGKGQSSVVVETRSPNAILQFARTLFSVTFGQ